jgi:hypothetical protein
MMKVQVWNARDARDFERWSGVHREWARREVYAHPSYVRLFAGERDEPIAVFAESASGAVLYPFVLRPIDAPHLTAAAPSSWDITSAYGYAGAFTIGDGIEAGGFWSAFEGVCRELHVVAEFARLSLFENQRLAYPGKVEQKLTNVVRELETPDDAMWKEFEHKVRKNVNKAQRSGVTVEVDETGERLEDFLRIYKTTMDRREAKASFYFPRSFFETIVRELPGQFAFFHALHEGRVVSTELVLVSADNTYSYLGGTEEAAFDLRPNDLLKVEVFRWSRQKGKKRFVIGGGYAPDDGIFKYKRAFAPNGLLPYFVGSRILDEGRYTALLEAHVSEGRRRSAAWSPAAGFFPAYRCDLPEAAG